MEQFKTSVTDSDTIAAISTPPGAGGIAVVRISGRDAISIAASAWHGKDLNKLNSHSATFGRYCAVGGEIVDECVATVFRAPHSFTGEDTVEISVHGSKWIQREVLADLIRRKARTAAPGEFTQRAFMNGRLDLAQAEGVADLIASSSKAAHHLALQQMQGRFSGELESLREKLIEFASLLELELDFSEEDVEFADRTRLLELAQHILARVDRLAASYSTGSALKEGIPVVIAGMPNAGKSSLLNLLLGNEKAIVTDIPGTTRDIIEDTAEIDGILYRFVDTAGLRETSDKVESIGIERALERMKTAAVVVWMIDVSANVEMQLARLECFKKSNPETQIIILLNKIDLVEDSELKTSILGSEIDVLESENDTSRFGIDSSESDQGDVKIRFSAMTGVGEKELRRRLGDIAMKGMSLNSDVIVTNSRHYESLIRGGESLRRAIGAIESGISPDFIAQDVRETVHHLGTITGTITTPDLLHSIFSRFCIGK